MANIFQDKITQEKKSFFKCDIIQKNSHLEPRNENHKMIKKIHALK